MITANNLTPPQNAFDQAAGAYGGANDIYTTMGVSGSLGNINSYLNPYYDQVLNSALGRLGTQENMAINSIGDSAIRSGAFGGSRHGVAEGITRSEFGKTAAELEADIRSRGFTEAAGMAMADKANAAAGLTQLGDRYFGAGNTVMDNQMQQGTFQQQLLQSILSGADSEFQDYLQNPMQMIDLFSSILSADARRGNAQTTQKKTPGLLDFLSLGLQAWGG